MLIKITFIICGLLIAAAFVNIGLTLPLDGEKTDCYDRYSNLIIGEECIVDNGWETRESAVIINSLVGTVILAGFVAFGIMFDDVPRGGI